MFFSSSYRDDFLVSSHSFSSLPLSPSRSFFVRPHVQTNPNRSYRYRARTLPCAIVRLRGSLSADNAVDRRFSVGVGNRCVNWKCWRCARPYICAQEEPTRGQNGGHPPRRRPPLHQVFVVRSQLPLRGLYYIMRMTINIVLSICRIMYFSPNFPLASVHSRYFLA